ncbi:DNA cytosine methyltransferase [Bacillus wiedmannii]|uniref:DNA cytosine methyltransferase n=1 Tax=Bacillus wiedmannii TaxID=1890302 RepID=UPI000BF7834E|nr:DNA (cytosine-5-)-methyltransferase [Bacillus wiedmannii]PEP21497.1 DNA (cytosine-5-)-methyltransferase [Bacillus wiedmannii]
MKMLDLFSGIGGISLAADWAGIETAAFCEIEPFNQKVLNKHWPTVPIFSDIRTLTKQSLVERGVDVGTIDVVAGGFPCQPYSVAGKQKGKEDDRDLWPEMFRIIEEIRPTWVVGENVANFANMELDRTLFNLESIGYKGKSFIIPACAVGARHKRNRIFIVAHSESESGAASIEREDCETEQRESRGMGSETNILPYTSSVGQRRQRKLIQSIDSKKNSIRETSEPIHVRFNGEWEVEPDVGRVANGIPNGMDRLRSLGNAVVPQQIYPIFEAIAKIEGLL